MLVFESEQQQRHHRHAVEQPDHEDVEAEQVLAVKNDNGQGGDDTLLKEFKPYE